MHARLHHVCICFSGVSCRVCLRVGVRPGGKLCALHSVLIETAGCSKVLLLLSIQQLMYRQEIFERFSLACFFFVATSSFANTVMFNKPYVSASTE